MFGRTVCRVIGLLLLCACGIAIFRFFNRESVAPVPVQAVSDGRVRVRATQRNLFLADEGVPAVAVSAAVAIICGQDRSCADRYEVRNDALQLIARRRDLTEEDVAALMAYVATREALLAPSREAALRNDVLNLLRNQEQVSSALPRLLMDIVRKDCYNSTLVDYVVQHLGALQRGITDVNEVRQIHDVLFEAASRILKPYAGTALYALADSRRITDAEDERLRYLTREACSPRANSLVRLSAFQLAGQRGYTEVLPDVRAVLRGECRDAVTDTVAVGTLGLLGDASDIELIRSIAAQGGSRLSGPCVSAIEKIERRLTE